MGKAASNRSKPPPARHPIDTEGSRHSSLMLIDLRWVFPEEIRDHSLFESYRQLLTEDERRRELRFRFEVDRRRYLVTRALVRTTLSRYVAIKPEAWLFSTNRYGRPQILNSDRRAKDLSFSISHTDDLIVLAVTFDDMIGVDVETTLRPAALDVANRYFSGSEVDALSALPASMRQARFFEYWTLKESYIKARGLGLSVPLDQFWFRFDNDNRVYAFMSPHLDDDPSRWRFWQFRPSRHHVAALCAERARASRQTLRMTRVVPLCIEEAVTYPVFRSSQ